MVGTPQHRTLTYAPRVRTSGVVLALLLVAAAASAQETGGSFESEDWGSSSSGSDWGSSSSGSSDWGSSDSSSYPTTDYDTSSGSSGTVRSRGAEALDAIAFGVAMIAVALVPLVVAVLATRRRRSGRGSGRRPFVHGPRASKGLVDVTMLQLGIDWRARRFVQSELAKLAQEGDTKTKQGRVALLRATTKALAASEGAWLYAGARNFSPTQPGKAQHVFQTLVHDVRASFRQEIVRAAAGRVVTVEAVGVRPQAHEGQGVVVVALLVAARREIFDVDAREAASIEKLVEALERLTPDDVVALSVVWTPAAEDDRMSTLELEARHPSLVKIGGIGGRTFCNYCHGPFAEELAACPHCGAPTNPMHESL